jgi:hypothetical protein
MALLLCPSSSALTRPNSASLQEGKQRTQYIWQLAPLTSLSDVSHHIMPKLLLVTSQPPLLVTWISMKLRHEWAAHDYSTRLWI